MFKYNFMTISFLTLLLNKNTKEFTMQKKHLELKDNAFFGHALKKETKKRVGIPFCKSELNKTLLQYYAKSQRGDIFKRNLARKSLEWTYLSKIIIHWESPWVAQKYAKGKFQVCNLILFISTNFPSVHSQFP